WSTMMAAMMLPGAAPAVARYAVARYAGARQAVAYGKASAAVPFLAAYLAIWSLTGVAAYGFDRPHGTLAAGVVVIAAGAYELPPLKRGFRHRCREYSGSGLKYGLCCLGSSAGLTAMLVALDVMSLFWMTVVAVIATAQKLLPAKAAVDVPLALAFIGFGILI